MDLLITHRTSIKITDYQELTTHYLRNKCNDIKSSYATLFSKIPSVLSSNLAFKLPSQLIDKRSNEQFTRLYEDSDDLFLNEDYYKDELVIFKLGQLGLIVKRLPNEFVLSLANIVGILSDIGKAKRLSANLLEYCQVTYNKIPSELPSKLLDIEWVRIDKIF